MARANAVATLLARYESPNAITGQDFTAVGYGQTPSGSSGTKLTTTGNVRRVISGAVTGALLEDDLEEIANPARAHEGAPEYQRRLRQLAEGQAAVNFEGRMIDVPVAERAKRVLALRDRIAAKALE